MKFRFGHFLATIQATAVALECHPQGPIVPRPFNLNASDTFRHALDNLTKTFDAAFTGDIKGGWDVRNVSMSIGLVSLDQDKPSVPIWEYHHLASGNVNGTKSLNRDSQYLIGSVSKVISDAILLRSGVNIDDPVTDFISSLNSPSSLISWNNITLRALASQLAGIPPNYGFSEYYYIKGYFESLGFPRINDSAFEPCGIIGLNGGCSKEQFLQGMLNLYPVAPPMSRPVYSNIAYTLLMYALESKTGRNFTQLLQDLITTPFNMPNTFPSGHPPSPDMNDSLAVIPPMANTWGSNYGDAAPGGGLVSSLADLSSFLHAILDRTVLDSPTEVREWLQPRSFAGSPHSFLGTPWEIFRPPPELLFPEAEGAGHTVTILNKDGAAYGYRARISVLDEYGVGIVVLTAGDQTALTSIYDAALAVLVPAVDAAARESAGREYVGGFAGLSTAETGRVPVNATTEMDGVSLKLVGLSRNGTDLLASLQEIWTVTMGAFLPSLEPQGVWRLYPAEIARPGTSEDGRELVLEDWRVTWEVELNPDTELPGRGLSGYDCLSWTVVDWLYYGSEPTDRVVFVKDAQTGSVLGLEVPFLRTGSMEKVRLP
ncbi:Beta-lactamase transpeptidase [Madurella fahalii]|uniref:Beta-lactamase transpeptidase n=1 Tax=Madurella fahalii TaxID=1157608 RepID=A0ABQ0GPT0_9PEZI